jgi:hypothetical protein
LIDVKAADKLIYFSSDFVEMSVWCFGNSSPVIRFIPIERIGMPATTGFIEQGLLQKNPQHLCIFPFGRTSER